MAVVPLRFDVSQQIAARLVYNYPNSVKPNTRSCNPEQPYTTHERIQLLKLPGTTGYASNNSF